MSLQEIKWRASLPVPEFTCYNQPFAAPMECQPSFLGFEKCVFPLGVMVGGEECVTGRLSVPYHVRYRSSSGLIILILSRITQ